MNTNLRESLQQTTPMTTDGTPRVPRFVDGSATLRSDDDVAAVLQTRLRTMAAILAPLGVAVAALGLVVGAFDSFARAFSQPPFIGWVLAWGMFVSAVGTFSTRPSRKLSMASLRLLEAQGIGSGVVFYTFGWWYGLSQMPASWIASFAAMDAQLGAMIISMCGSIFWVSTMMAYGIYIPNTWRRVAVVVALMSLLATIPDWFVLRHWNVSPAFVWTYFGMRFIWLADGALFSIYGTRRIEALRSDVAAARKLGQYVLKSPIGSGGMGEVYLAEHTFLRRPCAVKLIRPGQHADATALSRFEREVQTTATLTHPNAVQIYDYGRADDGTFFYAMEYLPGVSLEQLVEREGPLAPQRVIHLARQLCGPLREAHQLGLIHRDIKPSNVLVCERGGLKDVAKLLDFGLVVPMSAVAANSEETRLTQAGMIVGTPSFMSPEQVGGEELAAASDIYSMGALLYFVLTGRPPFDNRSVGQVLAAHIYEIPRPPSELRAGLPSALDAVVLKCLAKKPVDRFASAEELERALA